LCRNGEPRVGVLGSVEGPIKAGDCYGPHLYLSVTFHSRGKWLPNVGTKKAKYHPSLEVCQERN
jgi:hypothetical protein